MVKLISHARKSKIQSGGSERYSVSDQSETTGIVEEYITSLLGTIAQRGKTLFNELQVYVENLTYWGAYGVRKPEAIFMVRFVAYKGQTYTASWEYDVEYGEIVWKDIDQPSEGYNFDGAFENLLIHEYDNIVDLLSESFEPESFEEE